MLLLAEILVSSFSQVFFAVLIYLVDCILPLSTVSNDNDFCYSEDRLKCITFANKWVKNNYLAKIEATYPYSFLAIWFCLNENDMSTEYKQGEIILLAVEN